jgi:excisionase family DNA binding protein
MTVDQHRRVVVSDDGTVVWLTASQAARRLGITLSALYVRRSRGQLRGYRLGRSLRFKADELDALLVKESATGAPHIL